MRYNRRAFNMLSVTEARERILSHFQTTATESIPLIACSNRVLAIDIAAIHDLPLFDNSAWGNLLSLVQADALLIIPAGVKCVPAGQEVEALLL